MSRESSRAALADEVQRFELDLRRMTIELVRAVFATELERRTKPKAARPKTARRRRQPARRARSRPQSVTTKTSLPSIAVVAHPTQAEPVGVVPSIGEAKTAMDQIEEQVRTADTPRWTRESVVESLGAWLFSGEPAEAAFIRRHGPKGLVPAATKFFGRFDAALNTANLAIAGQVDAQRKAKGPEARERLPSLRELARRQQQRRRAAAGGPT